MHKIYKKRWFLILSFVIIFWSFIVEQAWLPQNINSIKMNITYIAAKVVIFIVVFFVSQWIYKLFIKCYEGDKNIKRFLSIWCFMFFIYFTFLLVTWPGNWNNDEYHVLNYVMNLQLEPVQNIITSMFFLVNMMIVPNAGFIIVTQILIITSIIAYSINGLYNLCGKKMVFSLLILFIAPPSLYFAVYPLRVTLYTYCWLLLISYILFNIKRIKSGEISKKYFYNISFLVSILGVWRAENIILIILFPIIIYIYSKKRKIFIRTVIAVLVPFLILNTIQNINWGEAKLSYQSTPFITGLSVVLSNSNVRSDNLERDLQNIDKVLPIDGLLEYPSSYEPFQYKASRRNDFSKSEFNKFLYSTINIIIRNPVKYTKSKIDCFLASTGMSKEWYWVAGIPDFEQEQEVLKTYGIDQNILNFMRPIEQKNRMNIINLIRGLVHIGKTEWSIYHITWNFFVPIISCILLSIFFIIKNKAYYIIGILLMIYINLFLVIMLSAAANVMYFFPFFILCYWMIGYFVFVLGIKKNFIGVNYNEKE